MSRTYRASHHREAILTELQDARTHLSAEDIFQRLRSRGSRVSFGTVYRNLRILQEQGRILELESRKEGSLFDANISPHSHFICTVCGKVQDVTLDLPSEIIEDLAQRYDIRPMGYQLTFHGLCRECKDQALTEA